MMSKDPVFFNTPIHLVIYIVIIIFQNLFFCVLQGYWTPHQLWLMQSHSLWRYFTHFIIVFSIKVLENSNSCPASKNNCWKSDDRQTTKNSFSPCVELQRSCGSSCEWEVALGWLDWQWIVSWSRDRARARRGHIRRTAEVKFNTGSSFTRVKFNKSNFKEFWQGSSLSFEFLLNECHSKAQRVGTPWSQLLSMYCTRCIYANCNQHWKKWHQHPGNALPFTGAVNYNWSQMNRCRPSLCGKWRGHHWLYLYSV